MAGAKSENGINKEPTSSLVDRHKGLRRGQKGKEGKDSLHHLEIILFIVVGSSTGRKVMMPWATNTTRRERRGLIVRLALPCCVRRRSLRLRQSSTIVGVAIFRVQDGFFFSVNDRWTDPSSSPRHTSSYSTNQSAKEERTRFDEGNLLFMESFKLKCWKYHEIP